MKKGDTGSGVALFAFGERDRPQSIPLHGAYRSSDYQNVPAFKKNNIALTPVTPAKAGVQGHKRDALQNWTPAFAGVTVGISSI
jgi:hypothetical protein